MPDELGDGPVAVHQADQLVTLARLWHHMESMVVRQHDRASDASEGRGAALESAHVHGGSRLERSLHTSPQTGGEYSHLTGVITMLLDLVLRVQRELLLHQLRRRPRTSPGDASSWAETWMSRTLDRTA